VPKSIWIVEEGTCLPEAPSLVSRWHHRGWRLHLCRWLAHMKAAGGLHSGAGEASCGLGLLDWTHVLRQSSAATPAIFVFVVASPRVQ